MAKCLYDVPIIERHLTVAGKPVTPPLSTQSPRKHSPLDRPANLPKCYLLSAPSATFASTFVSDGSVPTICVTMPVRTSHEAARITSNLSMYNKSLIPHLYEGLTKVLQSYLPAPCRGVAASPTKRKKPATPELHRFSLQPHRWSRLRYAPPVTRAEVNGPNALYSKDDCARNR